MTLTTRGGYLRSKRLISMETLGGLKMAFNSLQSFERKLPLTRKRNQDRRPKNHKGKGDEWKKMEAKTVKDLKPQPRNETVPYMNDGNDCVRHDTSVDELHLRDEEEM
ncbi:hypothetical protein Fmac_027169 [Flemingia macrophylla]|uniref:Uncharacterized protein n=1 Tax=Flemingia macrophylla TaxID=520843 RepID=A0ABD1LIM1_9FABA